MLSNVKFINNRRKFLWTPEKITTLAWWDPSDSNTITQSGGFVSQINDKSGNSWNARQPTGSRQPSYGTTNINGLNVLSFDGNDDILHFARTIGSVNANDYIEFWTRTVYSVVKPTSSRVHRIVSSRFNVQLRIDGDTNCVQYTGSPNPWTSALSDLVVSMGNPHMIGYQGTSELLMTLNGNTFYNPIIAPDTYQLPIGTIGAGWSGTSATNPFLGSIAEIIIVNTSTDSDRWKIEGYLAWKWGLVSNLPSDHQYKLYPPVGA